jgi:mannose-6-phosphate isomerase
MSATRLETIRVEKPWGRSALWPGFGNPEGKRIGEIWFEAPEGSDPALMVKYLFTSEKLSIQVHPGDAAARAAGYARGKDEAWVILEAEPDSTIALGTVRDSTRADLRAAALDGSIETLVDWKAANAGDIIYSPAGTVHAIGAGLTLIEVQQNVDLTYRLYDYGRPRELHLDQGIAVSDPVPFTVAPITGEIAPGREILCEGDKFVLERWCWTGDRHVSLPDGLSAWLIPVKGTGKVDAAPFCAGECWMMDVVGAVTLNPGCELLFAYATETRADLFA